MNLIPQLEAWLRAQYKAELGLTLHSEPSADATCLWIPPKDDSESTAALLDKDLGTWFKFIQVSDRDEVGSLVEREVQRALGECSQLLRRTGLASTEVDLDGAWSISLLFLVKRDCQGVWESAVQSLRSNSGFTEELALDRILVMDEADLKSRLDVVGVPQLLLATRKLLKLNEIDIGTWLSADSKVQKFLERLPDQFADPSTVALVKKMVDDLRGSATSGKGSMRSKVPYAEVGTLEITGLRNISAFSMPIGSQNGVAVNIVHGPNGTGKSSLFEAISLATMHSSGRLATYLRDKDIAKKSVESYVSEVLTPLDASVAPQVRFAGVDLLKHIATTVEDAEAFLNEGDGTMLAQHDARAFVTKDSASLGARVLSGYSSLAQALQSYCDREFSVANVDRQEWLRRFATASITKAETRVTKLIEYCVDKDVPRASQHTLQWLHNLGERYPEYDIESKSLAARLTDVDSVDRRQVLTRRLFELERLGFDDECYVTLSKWLEERNAAISSTADMTAKVQPQLSRLSQQRVEVLQDIEQWWRWLVEKNNPATEAPPNDLVPKEIRQLQLDLKELAERGAAYSAHLQHLSQVSESYLKTWAHDHPANCPTCNAEHSGTEGILGVVERLKESVSQTVTLARAEYANKLKRLRSLEKDQPVGVNCPLSIERRQELSEMMGRGAVGYEQYEVELRTLQRLDPLTRSINILLTPPSLEKQQEPRELAREIWDKFRLENSKGEVLWELPTRWMQVRDIVNRECLAIVKEHLPKTLEAVWHELTLVLTPARWNLASDPVMEADTKRGSERLQIVVKTAKRQVQVRHIFNEAENHVLGLAWFFTRYLSHGRFARPLLVLDDPAQEMDQTTFRALTRWLQFLCRLHKRKDIPLNLIVFLHQEDRALDAARATDHHLMSLKWARKISSQDSVERIVLLSPGFEAPLPKPLNLGVWTN